VHGEEKAWTGRLAFILFTLITVVIPSLNQANASSANTTVNQYITGTSVILDSPPLDLCHALNRSPCPIRLTVKESFGQKITASLAADRTVLQSGDSVMVSVNPNPSIPSASLDIIFTFGDRSYDYIYSPYPMPKIGLADAGEIAIPGSTLFSALDLPPLAVNLTVTSQVTAALVGQFSGTGFSGGQSLEWSSIQPKTISSTLSGVNETSDLSLSLVSSQDWQSSLYLTSPIIGRIPVYGVPHSEVTFRSNEVSDLVWYRLSTKSDYSNLFGQGWYFSGTSTTISVSDNITNINPGERKVFAGWQGTGIGSYSGPEQQRRLTVDNPMGEAAQWKTQYLVTLNKSNGGTVIPGQASGWYDDGYRLVLEAGPSPPQQFLGWVINGHLVSRSPTYTHEVNSTSRILAEFSAGSQTATASIFPTKAEPEAGTGEIVPGVGKYYLISVGIVLFVAAIGVILTRRQR
jgi:hypothetical protein